MKKQKLIAMTMATALSLSLSLTTGVLAANTLVPGYGGNKPGPDEIAANGHTTISIFEAKMNPKNVSFEVPLYVTMAVVDNEADVVTPDNYQIRNTTSATDGAFDIGVTAMYFAKLTGSTFQTVTAAADVAAEKDIYLTIGDAKMPALSSAVEAKVDLTGSVMLDGNGKSVAIKAPTNATGGNDALKLTIAGTVTAATRNNTGAVAQFRVKYTVSPLDNTGAPLGVVYAGDDSYVAGLGAQPAPAPVP